MSKPLILALIVMCLISLPGCSAERSVALPEEGELAAVVAAMESANRAVLFQTDVENGQVELNQTQVQELIQAVHGLKEYPMPNPYGSGYPGYQVRFYTGERELAVLEILDSHFACIQGLYYENAGGTWDLVVSWHPPRSFDRGELSYLFHAERMALAEAGGTVLQEYGLGAFSFRMASIVRILREAVPGTAGAGISDPELIIYFYIGDEMEEVVIFMDHLVYNGNIFALEQVGIIIRSAVSAG